MIKDNLTRIQDQIDSICRRLGHNPDEVTLIGVTKFAEIDKIQQAVNAGLRHVAENKVQEGQRKYPLIREADGHVTRHLIGHLQTNKVKQALEIFDLIHSVDSPKLAIEIDKQAGKINKTAEVLIQVNTAGEEQKYGAKPLEALALIEEAGRLQNLRVLGLMAMAPFTEDQEIIRQCFKALRELYQQAQKRFNAHDRIQMKYLSMGMSGDFEIALEEGANMVRIGSAIFKGNERV